MSDEDDDDGGDEGNEDEYNQIMHSALRLSDDAAKVQGATGARIGSLLQGLHRKSFFL